MITGDTRRLDCSSWDDLSSYLLQPVELQGAAAYPWPLYVFSVLCSSAPFSSLQLVKPVATKSSPKGACRPDEVLQMNAGLDLVKKLQFRHCLNCSFFTRYTI